LSLSIQPFDVGLGAAVSGIDLSQPYSEDDFDEIELAFYDHAVLVFRGQTLEPEQYINFGARFGEVVSGYYEPNRMRDHPEIIVASNYNQERGTFQPYNAGRYWHKDRSYLPAPTSASLLYAIEVPHDGIRALGDTYFADTVAAYYALPAQLKDRLESLQGRFSIAHMHERFVADGVQEEENERSFKARIASKFLQTVHRIVQTHPLTDRRNLFLSEAHMVEILDVSRDESQSLMRCLFQHMTKPEFIYRHRWQVGDVLMWDNMATIHRADSDYAPPMRRTLQRITLKGPRIP